VFGGAHKEDYFHLAKVLPIAEADDQALLPWLSHAQKKQCPDSLTALMVSLQILRMTTPSKTVSMLMEVRRRHAILVTRTMFPGVRSGLAQPHLPRSSGDQLCTTPKPNAASLSSSGRAGIRQEPLNCLTIFSFPV